MKKNGWIKLILMIIIALVIGKLISPIIIMLSGIISFGMGMGLAYLLISYLEDKWEWFR